MRTECLIK